MQGTLSHRSLLQPKSLTDALKMLRDEGPLTPMAGCTDLYVNLNFGTLKDERFLNLWGLAGLRSIDVRRDVVVIGAMTTHTDLIRSAVVNKRLPMLAAAAVVVLKSTSGTRRVPFTSFYTGYRQSVRRPDELIVAFEIPPVRGRQWFRKVGTRAAQAISKIVMAGVRDRKETRIALGSVAPTVLRARKTEAALTIGASLAIAQQTLLEEIAPIDDIRSTAEYRRAVSANLLARFLSDTSRG